MRKLYRLLSVAGSVRAASRGPGALARRQVRRVANRSFNRTLKKVVKP